jgi:5-methylcytosine-specific restriction endonuclease McrA
MPRDKKKYNEYMRWKILERYHARRDAALEALGGKCTRCGTIANLQFDHIDRHTKEFPVSKMWSLSEKRFWAEIAKCQILCNECHKIKSKENNDYLGKRTTPSRLKKVE